MQQITRTSTALTLVVAMGLAACSSGSSGDAAQDAQDQLDEQLEELGIDPDVVDDLGDVDVPDPQVGQIAEPEAPTFVLMGDVEPPEGWVEDPSNCAEPEPQGPPFFTYYVPAEWNRVGSGHGGGGGVGGSGDHSYEVGDSRVEIEISEDNWTADGVQGRGGSSEVWTTWDYEITTYEDSGDVVEQITYDEVEPVEIDGETVDLFYLDEVQSENVQRSEYRTRVIFGEVPSFGAIGSGDDRQPASATVTLLWNDEDVTFAEADAAEILSTFRLSQCAADGLTERYELMLGADFSG